jgi:competence protein ComEA
VTGDDFKPPSPVRERGSADWLASAWPRSARLSAVILVFAAACHVAAQSYVASRHASRPTAVESGASQAYLVDLNAASRAELMQLPGVGESLADRIEAYRKERGGFRRVGDLVEIHGVGAATLARLQPWVRIGTEAPIDESGSAATSPDRGTVRKRITSPGPMESGSKKAVDLAERIDINRATATELERLPGVGPKMAQRIIEVRAKRLFQTVDDLRRVPGIGPKTLERLRPFIVTQVSATPLVLSVPK